jgi:hypothetical protein
MAALILIGVVEVEDHGVQMVCQESILHKVEKDGIIILKVEMVILQVGGELTEVLGVEVDQLGKEELEEGIMEDLELQVMEIIHLVVLAEDLTTQDHLKIMLLEKEVLMDKLLFQTEPLILLQIVLKLARPDLVKEIVIPHIQEPL